MKRIKIHDDKIYIITKSFKVDISPSLITNKKYASSIHNRPLSEKDKTCVSAYGWGDTKILSLKEAIKDLNNQRVFLNKNLRVRENGNNNIEYRR